MDGGGSFTEVASVGRWGGEDFDFPVDTHDPSSKYVKTTLSDDTGSALASGVDTVRIGISDSHTGWLEWDVVGTATAPPPTGITIVVK